MTSSDKQDEAIVVLVTTGSAEESERIARALVEERIVACVNIVPGITSIFRWEGKIEHSAESLMICKTKRDRFDDLTTTVKQQHSYSTPEIVAISAAAVETGYLRWLMESVAR